MNRIAGALVAIVCLSSVAHAGVEFGGVAGFHGFSVNNGLGVEDNPMATSERNSALFGVRLGVYFGNSLGVEGEVGVIPTESRTLVFDIYNLAYRGSLVMQFRAADPANMVIPFVLVGAGALQVVKTNDPLTIREDRVLAPHVGFGIKYRASGGFGLRGDVRALLPPSSQPDSKFAVDYEILMSLFKEWGRPQKVVIKEAAPPSKTDDDPDKDGIAGAADKCPNEAEDKDGFEDDDGCPDPDNDGDGIADAADKCPAAAEDKDGFEDNDGCPDPDNDGDGVPDAADKCVDKPETKNGFEDDDGCPDEIPEKLKQFTGVIQGINFKVSSADLAAGSSKALDKAIAVLAEYKDIKLEIQGHTDDQPAGKGSKFADNQALSQARAESVKAYFVGKGIEESRLTARGFGDSQPVEDPAGLKAGKLNAARAKNRRVEFKLISADAGAPAAVTPEKTP
jgi:OOP family OmpA-OmpF porin